MRTREVEGVPVVLSNAGGNFANLTVPSAFGSLLQGIAVGDRWIFAGTSVGASARHEIQAEESHPAITDQATVSNRIATRRVVTADETYPAPGYDAALELRSADREEVQARISFLDVATYAVEVSHRTPATSEVQAVSHLRGVFIHRSGEPTYVRQAGSRGIGNIRAARLNGYGIEEGRTARREVQASETYPAALPTVGVEVRKPARHEITAEGHQDPPDVITTALFKRAAVRKVVTASVVYSAATFSVAVSKRPPARLEVEADAQHFPSLTGTANVFKTVRLYADKALPAVSGTVQVQKRDPRPLCSGGVGHLSRTHGQASHIATDR